MFVTGVVLAAGTSRRLGQPKQLLPYRDGTLLGAAVARAARCGFDQLVVTLGGAAEQVRARVDLGGTEVVETTRFAHGCAASVAVAIAAVDQRADGVVMLLGDQPEVSACTVQQLIAGAGGAPLGVCRYADGRGHPFWFGRETFADLGELHGDKAMWKLLESGRYPVTDVDVAGTVPVDVDTWDDYQTLLARHTAGAGPAV